MQVPGKGDLTMLEYNQWIQFIPQLAFVCFQRPPKDVSHMPPVECLKELLSTFEQATRERGKSTVIYEDPDHTSFGDNELVNLLEQKINQDPSYPIPEGFRK